MDKKQILGLAANRTDLINAIIDNLDAKVSSAQEKLLRIIIDDFVDKLEVDGGKIVNSLKNKQLLTLLDEVYQQYSNTAGLDVVKGIVDGVQQVVDFNKGYFDLFEAPTKLEPIKKSVDTLIKTWLGVEPTTGKLTKNGYLDVLVKDATVKNQIADTMVRQISGGSGYQETKAAIKDLVVGKPGETGALNKYYRNFVYDAFSQVDRATSQTFADNLGLNYAVYEGGVIKTSRQFCKDHNGKVYTREEIAEFDPGEKNKQPGYNPFTDLGGYGCRHHLNWIPKALAMVMRPDLAGAPAPPPAPAPDKPKEPEKPKVQPPKPEPKKPKATPAAKPAAPVKDDKPAAISFDEVKTHKEVSAKVDEVMVQATGVKPGKIVLFESMPIEQAKRYGNQLSQLGTDYEPFTGINAIDQVSFRSTKTAYGSVKQYTGKNTGHVVNANFGSVTGDAKSRKYVPGATETRFKSRVDEDKLELSTITHEYAHFITTSEAHNNEIGWAKDARIKPFWQEMKALRKEYHTELLDLHKSGEKAALYEISLGKYASSNVDEFFAEGFTEYKLSSKPSKYAKEIGKVVEKYFKRK